MPPSRTAARPWPRFDMSFTHVRGPAKMLEFPLGADIPPAGAAAEFSSGSLAEWGASGGRVVGIMQTDTGSEDPEYEAPSSGHVLSVSEDDEFEADLLSAYSASMAGSRADIVSGGLYVDPSSAAYGHVTILGPGTSPMSARVKVNAAFQFANSEGLPPFVGTALAGAELGNFNYGAGRHVVSSSGTLDFRPGKTIYISFELTASASASNEVIVGCYSGAYSSGKGWIICRGASSEIIYITKWDGSGYAALAVGVRLGVRQLAVTWKASDNTLWVSMDGSAAASVGSLSAPNTDAGCKVAVGSPVTTGSAYADSLANGAVGCFGMVGSELSSAQLAAASSWMDGATPLNRFTLPSQYASPVADFNAYRDWDGVASTITTQGSSPVVFAVTGAVSRIDTSETYYATTDAMYHDSKLSVAETYAVRRNAFARLRFTTSGTRLAIQQVSTIQGIYGGTYAASSVWIGGAYLGVATAINANVQELHDVTLTAGVGKAVDVVEGLQSYYGGDVLGTFVSGIRIPSDGVVVAPSYPSKRVVAMGNSILNGFTVTSPQSQNPIAVLRGTFSGQVTLLGWGSAYLYTFSNPGAVAGWAASIAQMLDGTSSNTLLIELQTNDYGLSVQSASAYATNTAALIDAVKAAVPDLQVEVLGAIERRAPASEAANGLGDTLDAYRSAASSLTSGRSWVHYTNLKTTVSPANYNADGIHPLTAGAAQIAAAYQSIVGP